MSHYYGAAASRERRESWATRDAKARDQLTVFNGREVYVRGRYVGSGYSAYRDAMLDEGYRKERIRNEQ